MKRALVWWVDTTCFFDTATLPCVERFRNHNIRVGVQPPPAPRDVLRVRVPGTMATPVSIFENSRLRSALNIFALPAAALDASSQPASSK